LGDPSIAGPRNRFRTNAAFQAARISPEARTQVLTAGDRGF